MSTKATIAGVGLVLLLMAAMGSDWNIAGIGLTLICIGVAMHVREKGVDGDAVRVELGEVNADDTVDFELGALAGVGFPAEEAAAEKTDPDLPPSAKFEIKSPPPPPPTTPPPS